MIEIRAAADEFESVCIDIASREGDTVTRSEFAEYTRAVSAVLRAQMAQVDRTTEIGLSILRALGVEDGA